MAAPNKPKRVLQPAANILNRALRDDIVTTRAAARIRREHDQLQQQQQQQAAEVPAGSGVVVPEAETGEEDGATAIAPSRDELGHVKPPLVVSRGRDELAAARPAPFLHAVKNGDIRAVSAVIKAADWARFIKLVTLSADEMGKLEWETVLLAAVEVDRFDLIGKVMDDFSMTAATHALADCNTNTRLLHVAAKHGCIKTMKLLIDRHGADIHSRDENGWSALAWAVCQERNGASVLLEILELTTLERARAFLSNVGKSLVDIALLRGCVANAHWLLLRGIQAVSQHGVQHLISHYVDLINYKYAEFSGSDVTRDPLAVDRANLSSSSLESFVELNGQPAPWLISPIQRGSSGSDVTRMLRSLMSSSSSVSSPTSNLPQNLSHVELVAAAVVAVEDDVADVARAGPEFGPLNFGDAPTEILAPSDEEESIDQGALDEHAQHGNGAVRCAVGVQRGDHVRPVAANVPRPAMVLDFGDVTTQIRGPSDDGDVAGPGCIRDTVLRDHHALAVTQEPAADNTVQARPVINNDPCPAIAPDFGDASTQILESSDDDDVAGPGCSRDAVPRDHHARAETEESAADDTVLLDHHAALQAPIAGDIVPRDHHDHTANEDPAGVDALCQSVLDMLGTLRGASTPMTNVLAECWEALTKIKYQQDTIARRAASSVLLRQFLNYFGPLAPRAAQAAQQVAEIGKKRATLSELGDIADVKLCGA
ncbi:hypothetical protein AMAG_10520 [Allomyces macrogynus ATCC 38327]|uniref:Uncharacterized protein n=1 Tax=Allomyces macrogynus (strain ATCC 38327) TaxID=578462 RepID=A0A0L0SVC2_ALLM3|nr:hypothetical protein AMAG_10520 [Allomyces macrogynus ATCC 38327]|eukprot:KNE66294.1 hypothetical protein AMAG_10520 [Allomyces macrogynus ATCC 38327]